MRSVATAEDNRVECHLIRRDMEYRLSVRSGKTVVLQETHRTPAAAAQRAETLRRLVMEGALVPTLAETSLHESEEQAS